MKTYISFTIFLGSFMFWSSHSAQTDQSTDSELIPYEEQMIDLYQSRPLDAPIVKETVQGSIGNSVFIEQIGIDNTVITSTNAVSTQMNLVQNGVENTIDIDNLGLSIEKNIVQNGDFNTIIDFSFDPNAATNLQILQDGNDLYFEKFGTNELTKNLKFTMSGSSRSIIVRSF